MRRRRAMMFEGWPIRRYAADATNFADSMRLSRHSASHLLRCRRDIHAG